MKLFFSIIIPTLNEELLLPKLLVDLKNQKDQNFEVIIVDGRSDDKTKEQALQFKNDLPLTFVPSAKRNLSFQRNLGVSKAKEQYVIFLDADSRISTAFTKKLQVEVKKSRQLIYILSARPQGGSPSDALMIKLANFFVEISQNSPRPAGMGGLMIFQKDYFNFLGGFKESVRHDEKIFFPEDHDLMLRVNKSGVRAKFIKRVKVGFSLRRMKKEGRLNVIKTYVASALGMTLKGKVDKEINYEMGGHLYSKKIKLQSKK